MSFVGCLTTAFLLKLEIRNELGDVDAAHRVYIQVRHLGGSLEFYILA